VHFGRVGRRTGRRFETEGFDERAARDVEDPVLRAHTGAATKAVANTNMNRRRIRSRTIAGRARPVHPAAQVRVADRRQGTKFWRYQGTLYSGQGAVVARDPAALSGTHIGREFDAQSSWRPNRHLEFGAGVGHIRSGDFLLRTKHAASYIYPYLMLNYNVN
jgi:hypothetical protein